MNEQARIEALFEEGKLTREQADALLAALEESTPSHEAPAAVAAAAPGHVNHVREPLPVEPEAAPTRPQQAAPQEPANLKWLTVDVLAGEVRVRVDDTIDFPVAVEGQVEQADDGARISQLRSDHPGNFLEKIIDTARASSVRVAIPRGWGVRLDIKGGESHVDGAVPYVSGTVRAGSVNIEETSGINLEVNAGEVRAGLRLLGGNHRISTTAGSARLKLLRGSNTAVQARTTVGGIRSPELKVRESGLSAEARGVVSVGTTGEATSTLTVSVVTGEIRLEATDE